MTRSLLLKGLAGVAALGGTVGGLAVYGKEIFGGWGKAPEEPKSKDVSNFTQKELIDKVGLNCQLTDGETEVNGTKDCTVKDNGSINIKKRDSEEEGVTFSNSESTKLKVSKSEESGGDGTDKYTKKLKFVVDSGDISLTKKEGSSTPTTIQKLEQFETYEIFLKNDGKFYLRRKTDSKEEKIKALGLPSGCTLPDTGDSSCTLTIEETKKVKFENQTGGVTVTGNSVTLKISKMGNSDTDFGESKYRFTFTFPGDVTINNKQLKGNTPYDFKIKKGETGNTLTLEKAWSEDKEFAKKAGLDCNDNTQCSISSGSKLNVKAGTKIKEGISSINTGTGKIKMETGQAGYNQGLKFTITSGDVTISDGTGAQDITKLEELETYEITEEGGKFYLSLKTSKKDGIKSSLVLPKGCDLPTDAAVNCTLSTDDFKNINFDGKGESTSGSGTLTISKTSSTDFPLGYKFTFNTTSDATIKSDTKIKAKIPTDFKIKKEEGKALSLEKAWSETKFAEKVGLDCTQSDGCCSKSSSSEQLNVKRGTDKKDNITSFSGASGSGKIKVEKDQAGYNQGLKFTITGGDVSLTGGTHSGSTDFSTLEELETYEITEEGGKYYLTRKTEAIKTIESLLGLADAGCSLSTNSCSLSNEQIKKVKFDGKDTTGPTMSSGNATLTITKGANSTDFPLGYKFTLLSAQEITIKTNEKVAANISTDFKIKKNTEGQSTSLTLEKAWTAESLGKKVGLQSCSTDNSSGGCTIDTSGGIKVKQQNKHDTDVKGTNLKKKTGASSGCNTSGKIKVTKDQAGYNQGFKFKIEDGNIEFDGSNGSSDKVHRLGEFETYEIKEEGTEWYLVRKERADKFIKDQLKLDGVCGSEKFPHGTSASTTCNNIDVEKLKKINFEGKEGHSWPTETIDVSLEIKEDYSLPGGFKFTFTDSSSSSSSTVCLPTGTSGQKVDLKKNTSGVVYKIKKSGSGDSVTLTLEKKDNGNTGGNSCK